MDTLTPRYIQPIGRSFLWETTSVVAGMGYTSWAQTQGLRIYKPPEAISLGRTVHNSVRDTLFVVHRKQALLFKHGKIPFF